MTSATISDIVERARSDSAFLQQLITSPEAALAEYPVTEAERAVLTARSPEQLFTQVVNGIQVLECIGKTCASTCIVTCIDTVIDGCAGTFISAPEKAVKPSQGFERLIETAKTDPTFFKRLQEDPAGALKGMRLNARERAALGANTPEKLLGLVVSRPAIRSGCDDTCGYTCDSTCGGGYTMSCGTTCNYTCDYTAGLQLWATNAPDPPFIELGA